MSSKVFICDSRDKVTDHSFTSDNTTSDFVIRLPEAIEKMTLVEAEIPLTYYVFNDFYNKMVFRDQANNYYLATIPIGTYDTVSVLPVLETAFNNSVELPAVNPGNTWINNNPGFPFLFTFNDILTKLELNVSGFPGGIQFISIADPNNADGIPLGLLDGDIPGITPILSPIRDQLSNCARLLGLTPDNITPNPLTNTDGFDMGVSFAFDVVDLFPNILNLSGEDYFFIKSDLIGISRIQQGTTVELDINENDPAVIEAAYKDRGIATKVQINQILTSVLNLKFSDENVIFFSEPQTDINFRLSFRNDIPINLNGVDVSYTIVS
jgi:hypothetical protein